MLSDAGSVSVMLPLTVLISSVSSQSARPISPRIEPFTVDARPTPVVEKLTDPFTVVSAIVAVQPGGLDLAVDGLADQA